MPETCALGKNLFQVTIDKDELTKILIQNRQLRENKFKSRFEDENILFSDEEEQKSKKNFGEKTLKDA